MLGRKKKSITFSWFKNYINWRRIIHVNGLASRHCERDSNMKNVCSIFIHMVRSHTADHGFVNNCNSPQF